MIKLILILLVFSIFQDLPYKPKEDFDIKLDYQFKQRPAAEKNSVHFDETIKEKDRRNSTSMLPYLIIKLTLLKVPEREVKVKLTNNLERAVYSKKVAVGSTIPINLGFTDDVKDRITPHEYYFTFVSAEKKGLSRIKIVIEEDGTFLVNGEKRGKF